MSPKGTGIRLLKLLVSGAKTQDGLIEAFRRRYPADTIADYDLRQSIEYLLHFDLAELRVVPTVCGGFFKRDKSCLRITGVGVAAIRKLNRESKSEASE